MMEAYRILIVDDEKNIRDALKEALKEHGYQLRTAGSGAEALVLLEKEPYHLVLLDLVLGDNDGLQILRHIKRQTPQTEVVIVTAFGTVETAVEALREGAYDYITKPIQLKRLRSYVQRILRAKQLEEENRRLRQQLRSEQEYRNIVGCSESLMQILELIDQVAPTDVPVLIQGETGTGKELVARAIHQRSFRSHGPFIALNCGALPRELFESELFGYEKGAFTGAHSRKKGRFEMADQGSLFLDEIAEMAMASQVDFLRILEEGKLQRLGSTETTLVDVRVIAATNKDLIQLCKEGRFREDVYFRLNVVRIDLPPLRERKEDVPLLVEHFVQLLQQKYRRPQMKLGDGVLDVLLAYDWPGNIRELKNSLERAVVLSRRNVISVDSFAHHLKPAPQAARQTRAPEDTYPLELKLEDVEKSHIRRVLDHFGGHRKQSAESLGISDRDLYYKIKKYGLKDPQD
jgi:DNA-binding NtrC family response regulator